MHYQLLRTKRKTLALTLDREGCLVARAPRTLPLAEIEAFIAEKQDWIAKTRARLSKLPPVQRLQTLSDGDQLPFGGQMITLQSAAVARPTLTGNVLLIPQNPAALSAVLHWADAQARRMLADRAADLSRQLALSPKALRITHAKGRWGSMSSRGTLSLNRALIHCPPAVVDYVIVHELCHIKHPNHSSAFWGTVALCLPGFAAHRDWLKAHSAYIVLLPAKA